MLLLFRKIRKKLLSGNNVARYLLYAIGEIFLVVIGILIAVQIDNWNENRKNQKLEKYYLNEILKDVSLTRQSIHREYVDKFDKKIAGLKLGKNYYQNPFQPSDTLAFLSIVTYGAVSGILIFETGDTYNELVNTGKLFIISNDRLRKQLTDLYLEYETRKEISRSISTDYAYFINGVRPFNYKNPSHIEPFDRIEMLNAFKTVEFGRLVDQELTYAYRTLSDCDVLLAYLDQMEKEIEKELNSK